jgi:hypothetical protein
MLSRNERIDWKAWLLKGLDPGREVQLDDAFTIHVEDAIRSSSLKECRLEIDNAIEVYEAALNRALSMSSWKCTSRMRTRA